MEKEIEIKLTRQEHMMITAILLMHKTAFIVPIHRDKRPLLNKIATDFSLRDIRLSIKKETK